MVNRAPLVQAPSRWLISDALSTNPASSADLGAAAPASPIVRFDQVGLAGGPGGWILRGLSFALAPGSFHWLTGGAGKTSLLGLIGLVERPSQGVAQVFGRDAAALSRKEAMLARRRIGLVLEPLTFVEHLSAWDNAAFAARVTGRKPDDYAGDVNAILKWVGLAKAADELPSALGVADRHRLALARALVNRPELLLVDEPADGFDDAARQRAYKLAGEIHAAGATVVMVCRDEAFAVASGRPVIRLQDGRVNLAEPEPA
jgi:cell division transport system ATP-binding protein